VALYVQERPSVESLEFDDEREIMSKIFDRHNVNQPSDELDYLNPSLHQDSQVLNIMPEVCRVTRVLLEQGL
jgi:hypothetical protein